MQTDRRRFLGGLLAAGVIPTPTWADAGTPAYLAAAATVDGRYVLCGISDALEVTFQIPLPARGHAAAAHPKRPAAVAFARRPGRFAIVINCMTGQIRTRLHAPEGRHFYGHGAFSQGGDWLFTTENDYGAGRGCIGVWDVAKGYRRTAEFDSGGIGPHDIKRLPGSETLVIANGGIETHPDTGRTKLNIPTMRSSLTYIDAGEIVESADLPAGMQKNSIRHLAVNDRGRVAFGMQWQGDGPVAALVGQHRRGAALQMMRTPDAETRRMNGYVGSIAYAADGKTIAVTSPRGAMVQVYDADQGGLTERISLEDVCGIANRAHGFAVTSGTGGIGRVTGGRINVRQSPDHIWDNHLIAV